MNNIVRTKQNPRKKLKETSKEAVPVNTNVEDLKVLIQEIERRRKLLKVNLSPKSSVKK